MLPRFDASGAAALLDELLNHAQGDTQARCDLLAGSLLIIIRGEDALAQIKRQSGHAGTKHGPSNGLLSFFSML